MRVCLLLSLLLSSSCVTQHGADCTNDSGLAFYFYDPEKIDCDATERAEAIMVQALEDNAPEWRGESFWHMRVEVGTPVADHGTLHTLPSETQCDLNTSWIDGLRAGILTHEVLHLSNNCGGHRVGSEGYLDDYGLPVAKGAIDSHTDWKVSGRIEATHVADTMWGTKW